MLIEGALSKIKLKGDLGIGEITAATTLASVAMSALYNFGFFFPIEWSLVSLLSIQDLVLGTLYALFPAALSVVATLGVLSARKSAQRGETEALTGTKKNIHIPWREINTFGPFALSLSVAAYAYLFQRPLFVYCLVMLGLMLITSVMRFVLRHKERIVFWEFLIAFSFLYLPVGLGIANVYALTDQSRRAITEITMQDKTVHRGVLFRTTSDYMFLRTAGAVRIVPMNQVSNVLRLDGGM